MNKEDFCKRMRISETEFDIKRNGDFEIEDMEQYLNSEVRINETEQGIFDWGLDFLEMQKKNLETSIKDLSGSVWMCKADKAHIEMQIQLLNKFVDLIKNLDHESDVFPYCNGGKK